MAAAGPSGAAAADRIALPRAAYDHRGPSVSPPASPPDARRRVVDHQPHLVEAWRPIGRRLRGGVAHRRRSLQLAKRPDRCLQQLPLWCRDGRRDLAAAGHRGCARLLAASVLQSPKGRVEASSESAGRRPAAGPTAGVEGPSGFAGLIAHPDSSLHVRAREPDAGPGCAGHRIRCASRDARGPQPSADGALSIGRYASKGSALTLIISAVV
jgi:hypothetical protein